jgi:hypothetical protein
MDGVRDHRMRPDAMPSTSVSLLRTVGKVRTIGWLVTLQVKVAKAVHADSKKDEDGDGKGKQ